MDLACVSVAALVVAILVSCFSRVNVGLLAIVFAWVIGGYFAGDRISPTGVKGVLALFPGDLFLTLTGATLLFMLAQVNGTLPRLAEHAVRACRGNLGFVPIMFFLLAMSISAMGAGNIAAVALVAPTAMAVAARAGIPPFLMAIMVGHGSIAGALSPFASMGIIANKLTDPDGSLGHASQTFLNNFLANVAVGFVGYLMFGGWRLFRRAQPGDVQSDSDATTAAKNADASAPSVATQSPAETDARIASAGHVAPFLLRHTVTLAVLAAMMAGVVFAKLDVGMAAVAGAVVLILFRMADEKEAFRAMPWGVIVMVCGMTLLVKVVEKTGGLDLFTDLIARYSTQRDINGLLAFVTGVISVFSSTSGVVLPAFLPTVPGLIQKLGGGDPMSIASAIIIGGNLVDVSPVSTIGALCLASTDIGADRQRLFVKLLVWGLSMSLVGGAICYVFLP